MAGNKKEDITVIAELRVQHSNDPSTTMTVKSFEKAWVQSQEWAKMGLYPINEQFVGFVRKD